MGAFRFERIPAVPGSQNNTVEFDSSADRAIARKYGWKLGSVDLRKTAEDASLVTFDVYARNNDVDGAEQPLTYRGELVTMTRDAIWSRQAAGNSYEERFPPTRESVALREQEFHLKPERV